jgi:opacity protein-like surface antigen
LKRLIITIILLTSIIIIAQPQFSEMAVQPGAFSRTGFGARGMGMGNAMSAVITGELVSYYNPAVTVFQENNSALVGYSFLSVDRNLNFLSYTRRFDFYPKKDSLVENPKPRNSAGVSIGVINAGVSNIDGRDNNGLPTGELSTSENQFYLAVANRFSDKFSVGITAKFYYYKLFEDINTTGFGVDIGALYKVNDEFTVALAVIDINSKYKWDNSPVYDRGVITEDKFPNLRKLGVSYLNKEIGILASLEYENSSAETNILRAGVEYNIYNGLYLRGGIDQFNISNTDWPIKPALGFSFYKSFGNFKVGVDYAFVVEQYSSNDRHIIGLTFNF